MPLLSGTDAVRTIYKEKKEDRNLNRRATKRILSDLSNPTDDKLKSLKLLPIRKQLKNNKAVILFGPRVGMLQTTLLHHVPVQTCTKPVSLSQDHQTLYKSPI